MGQKLFLQPFVRPRLGEGSMSMPRTTVVVSHPPNIRVWPALEADDIDLATHGVACYPRGGPGCEDAEVIQEHDNRVI